MTANWKTNSRFADAEWWDRVRADYEAVKSSRLKTLRTGLPAQGSDSDWHYRSEHQYLKLAELARDDERNSLLIRSGIRRLSNNVVRSGFTLDVDTGDKDIDDQLQARWRDWSTDRNQCDVAGRLTFAEMESLIFRSVVRDGDICVVPLKNNALRIYESHRLRTPRNTSRKVVHGVLLDEFRRPREYWFTKEDISAWRHVDRVSDITPIKAFDSAGNRQVFHIFFPDRVSQTRGVTALAPSTDVVQSHEDLQWANLVKAKVSSAVTFIRNRDASFDGDVRARESGLSDEGFSGEPDRILQNWGPGAEVFGEIGETITGFSPNVPNPEFFNHAMLLLTFIACNLDLPLQLLLLDPTKSTFSSWRGAMEEARKTFETMQEWLSLQFHREVYRWRVRRWIASDQDLATASISGNIDIFRHHWHPPRWDYIEPETDAKADKLQQDNCLNSPRRIQAKRGRRYEDIAWESVQDRRLVVEFAIEAAREINQANPDLSPPIDWHELAPTYLADNESGGSQPREAAADESPIAEVAGNRN